MRACLPFCFLLGCAPAIVATPSPPAEPWLHDDAAWPLVREGLAGAWLSDDGNWRLEAHAVARDSALVQTWHSGGGETLNLFHPDGDALVVTHVCAQGNQATLRARSREGDRIVFEQSGVSNFAPGSGALCRLDVTIATNEVRMIEQYCDGAGAREAPTTIVLRRAP